MVEVIDSQIIYQNPTPQIWARNAWHPSLVNLDGGRWLCSFDLGQGPESHDYGTYTSTSEDDCISWNEPRRILTEGSHLGSYSLRVSKMSDGELVAFGALHRPRSANQGLLNPGTFGYAPMDLALTRSKDDGGTWLEPKTIDTPLEGCEFETCHSVVELADGRWLAPTCTWMSWDGSARHGMKAIALESRDKGATWDRYTTIMDFWNRGTTAFENSLVQLSDGSLVAVAWAYNVRSGKTERTPYATSIDGTHFGEPRTTGFHAQTAKLLALADDTLLCAYRRHDAPGLWVDHANITGGHWRSSSTSLVWSGAKSGMTGNRSNSAELSDLRFGYPSMVLRSDGDIELAFWCREADVNVIRRLRMRV